MPAGAEINELRIICSLADEGKCVVYRGGRTPAAFIQNFQARFLLEEMVKRVIKFYIPKTKTTKYATRSRLG